jgi:hypothetical protein
MPPIKTDEGLKRVIGVPGFALDIINNTMVQVFLHFLQL